MKKLGPLLFLVLLLGGGYWVYTQVLGGSLTGTGPTEVPTDLPDVDLPDPDDAVDTGADGARDGANWLADFLAGLSPSTWQVIGVVLLASALYWVWKDPKRRALALALCVIALLVVVSG